MALRARERGSVRALAMSHEIFDRSPVRRKEQDFFARINNGLKSAEQTLHAAVYDNYILFMGTDEVPPAQLINDCPAQLRYS